VCVCVCVLGEGEGVNSPAAAPMIQRLLGYRARTSASDATVGRFFLGGGGMGEMGMAYLIVKAKSKAVCWAGNLKKKISPYSTARVKQNAHINSKNKMLTL
jgi:hypothetical protein